MTTATHDQGLALLERLRALGVDCQLADAIESPQLVRYELKPGPGARMADFTRLNRSADIAYALQAQTVRIQAPIPGKQAVGVEVNRPDPATVPLEELPRATAPLNVPIGISVDGKVTCLPITEAPHALVAGQTGAGKSMLLHVIIGQLMRSFTPREVQFVLVDPKRVEFSRYSNDSHLADRIEPDSQLVKGQLEQLVIVMEARYRQLEATGSRDLAEHNRRVSYDMRQPYIVLVADEIAELVMTVKGAEELLVRLAQKGRAAGIHLILATQYPKAEVITGLLRVNVPTKIALRVPDKTASRVVMDQNGAETLLGRGDALISLGGLPPVRFQTAFTTLLSHSKPPEEPDMVWAEKDDARAQIAADRVSLGLWRWSGTITLPNGQTEPYSTVMAHDIEPIDASIILRQRLADYKPKQKKKWRRAR